MRQFIILIFLSFFFCLPSHADELITEPDAGRASLLSMIDHATHSIDLVVYGFTDPSFVSTLIDAKKSGKDVTVLLEAAPYKNEHENDVVIKQLTDAHINVIYGNPAFKYTHQKTFILDQTKAIVMTFNLTRSTFQRERNFALIITDPNRVHEIENAFHADIQRSSFYPNQSDLIWSPQNSRSKLISALRNAKSSVDIYAENLNDYAIIGALAALSRQGVTVRVLHSADASQSKKFRYLKKSGVQLKKSKKYLIHAKVIIIDHQAAILGSTNLTKNSIDHNRELSVVTRDPKVVTQLEETFQRDWIARKKT